MRTKKKGFTLTEILIALGIFAIGGTAIMALFITNVRLSAQAMDYTRAAEIQRNVRAMLTQAVSRADGVSDEATIYEFTYPSSSLTFVPSKYISEVEQQGETFVEIPIEKHAGTPSENTIYFRLPRKEFDVEHVDYTDVPSEAMKRVMTSLPNEACDARGRQITWGADASGGPEVFRFKPAKLRQAGALFGFDKDDRMFYSFDFSIRRSVARSGVAEDGNSAKKELMSGLYVVHLRVYKGFSLPEENGGAPVDNSPIYETDFLITAAE